MTPSKSRAGALIYSIAVLALFSLSALLGPAASAQTGTAPPTEDTAPTERGMNTPIEDPDAPFYSPFTARYLLDEVRQMRMDVERTRANLIERQVQREYEIAKDAAGYARNAVELFFFIITAVTTLLVFLGWNSIRDIRARVREIAESRVESLVAGYSARLDSIEKELQEKSISLRETSAEILETNEIHSLWLRAAQESTPAGKIAIYDEILKLRHEDTEALTFKADAALQLDEPQWALSLSNRALAVSEAAGSPSGHALYQRACARTTIGALEEAFADLEAAIAVSETYRTQARSDPAFDVVRGDDRFVALVDGALADASVSVGE